jgi:hypothetical protein
MTKSVRSFGNVTSAVDGPGKLPSNLPGKSHTAVLVGVGVAAQLVAVDVRHRSDTSAELELEVLECVSQPMFASAPAGLSVTR